MGRLHTNEKAPGFVSVLFRLEEQNKLKGARALCALEIQAVFRVHETLLLVQIKIKNPMHYTAAQIRENLGRSNAWLERSILAINQNGGFRETDADYLSYVAEWIQSGKKLNGKHVRRARALMMKYASQLAEIANAPE